jgi:hypothetical protein
MVLLRGGFSQLLAPGYRKIVFETYKERPVEGTRVINMNTEGKRAYLEDFNLAGFGTLQQKPEGGPVVYQDIKQGTPKRYTWTTYALGFRITAEMMDDDLYGIMGNKLSKALGRSSRNNQELVIASVLNNAFDPTVLGFAAGESLLGLHTSLRGVVQRNAPITPTDFSLPALQAALEFFHNLKDEGGLPAMFHPKFVVHNVGDYWMVNQVLKSQFLPGGNQNDINQVAREGLEPILYHYLTDTDAWFVIADNHDMNFFSRRPFTFSNTDDFETGDAKFKGSLRSGAGYGDWRGVYGSPGA